MKFEKIKQWLLSWGLFLMVTTLFIQKERVVFGIYPTHLLPTRTEKIYVNYTYPDRDTGYDIDGTNEFLKLREYVNRDSLLRGKFNSRSAHNYLLNQFKMNKNDPNILQCDAEVVGFRWVWPTSYPDILKINCHQ